VPQEIQEEFTEAGVKILVAANNWFTLPLKFIWVV
jgi:hypothetical protein